MNSLEPIIDIFNKLNKEKKFSIRNNNNKIFLDFEIKGYIPQLKLIQLLYKYDTNFNEILLLYKSNLDLNKILKMNLDEFFKCIFSTITSLKCKFKNLKKFLLYLKQERDEQLKKEEEPIPVVEPEEELKEVEEKKEEYIDNENNIEEKPIEEIKVDDEKKIGDENDIEKYRFYSSDLEKRISIINLLFLPFMPKTELNFSTNNIPGLLLFIFKKQNMRYKDLKDIIKSFCDDFIKYALKNNNIFNFLKLDNILISFLFVKYKSGFTLDINTTGLTNIYSQLYPTK